MGLDSHFETHRHCNCSYTTVTKNSDKINSKIKCTTY